MGMLTTTGAENETPMPFAGLHRLLRPAMRGVSALAPIQRQALASALGSGGAAPDPFLVGLAVLNLLGESSAERPLVVMVDDLQWVDTATTDALAFIARRLETERIVLVVACRDGFGIPLPQSGALDISVDPLADEGAAALVASWYPDMGPAARRRLLDQAQGNPLALIELPLAWAQLSPETLSDDLFAVTERLERAFAARAVGLPADCQSLLLLAALNAGGAVSEVIAAYELLGPTSSASDALDSAVEAGLISLSGTRLQFHHPLVPSSLCQAASPSKRRAAHAALAETLRDDPDRAIWHRAACATGPDESVASELESAGWRARTRGGTRAGATALRRAAELSERSGRRGSRLLAAAELVSEIGAAEEVRELAEAASLLPLSERDQIRVLVLEEFVAEALGNGTVESSLTLAGELARGGETELALSALLTAAFKRHWFNMDERIGQRIVAAADGLDVAEDDPKLLAIYTFAAPAQRGSIVVRLAQAPPPAYGDRYLGVVRRSAGEDAYLCGIALSLVQEYDAAARFHTAAIERLRRGGQFGLLAASLSSHAFGCLASGDWHSAEAAADECRRIALEINRPRQLAVAQLVRASLAAHRGDQAGADVLMAAAEEILAPYKTSFMFGLIQMIHTGLSLAAGAPAEAFEHARRVSDPSDVACHPFAASHAAFLIDLADAAVRSHSQEGGWAAVDAAGRSGALVSDAVLAYARAVLEDGEGSEANFRRARTSSQLSSGFLHARVRLGFGTWLRRQRRSIEARVELRSAAESFELLGAEPWSERAWQELRASGESSRRRVVETRDDLSPQELQIASLAAGGLTNRDIADRLFVSHRTVGSHLYRLFPKLGISSRAELPQAIQNLRAGGASAH
jgi:DNA-binding CsgD family transcriptional regulator